MSRIREKREAGAGKGEVTEPEKVEIHEKRAGKSGGTQAESREK